MKERKIIYSGFT